MDTPDAGILLCDECQYLFDHFYFRYINHPKLIETPVYKGEHHSFHDLEANAAKGCRLCQYFIRSFEDRGTNLQQLRERWSGTRSTLGFIDSTSGSLKFGCGLALQWGEEWSRADSMLIGATSHYDSRSVQLSNYRTLSDGLLSVPLISRSTDTESTWQRAREWIDWCTRTATDLDEEQPLSFCKQIHSNCHRTIMDRKLPTRLIYVSENDQGVRLCITKDIETHRTNNVDLKYASLSHCWGTKQMLVVTTQNNIKNMLLSIPVFSLTKTFRDAITITRRLKLQYLWIDSLCIIQGDEDDWIRESAMTASVYAGCFVNLVASAAPDGSVGCLFDRNRDYEYGFKAFIRSKEEEEERDLWNFFPEGPGDGYTGARAWCFQETFLAPRSIFFHQKQIYWECRLFRASEAFSQGLEFNTDRNRWSITKWQRDKDSATSQEWLYLVNRYSHGKLTYWKDRLPALSGIARVFCKAHALNFVDSTIGDRQHYLAGMWRFDLERQLFWVRLDHTQKIIRPGDPYRPTWSWASLAGVVGVHISPSIFNFRIRDARVTLATADEYGEVTSGSLQLECHPLIRATLTGQQSLSIGRVALTFHEVSVYLDDEPVLLPYPDVFAMHGAMTRRGDQTGLLLLPTEANDTYRRVGTYKIMREDLHTRREIRKLLPFDGSEDDKIIITIV